MSDLYSEKCQKTVINVWNDSFLTHSCSGYEAFSGIILKNNWTNAKIHVYRSKLSLASNGSDGWITLFHPFSSNKIRAKILDLGYGGARRALHNLSPKSARILSAAITRTILLPAGARRPVTKSTRG